MPCFGRIVPTIMPNMTSPKAQQNTRTNLLYVIIRSIPANHLNNLGYTLELLEEYMYVMLVFLRQYTDMLVKKLRNYVDDG
jgi:hypothetical protein